MMGVMDSASSMLRLGAIDFINTWPLYGTCRLPTWVQCTYAPPAALNQAIGRGLLDVSPVSSAYYLRHQDDLVLLPQVCVSARGAVGSVLYLCRHGGAGQATQRGPIAVPDDSETSVALLRWLLWQHTGHDPQPRMRWYPAASLEAAMATYGQVLVIGDRALATAASGLPPGWHATDLAAAWHSATGLPFVFAVWVARRSWLAAAPEASQHAAQVMQKLAQQRDDIVSRASMAHDTEFEKKLHQLANRAKIPPEALRRYFTQCLDYTFTPAHQVALDAFAEVLGRPAQVGAFLSFSPAPPGLLQGGPLDAGAGIVST
jgi:chorismate dehydratase